MREYVAPVAAELPWSYAWRFIAAVVLFGFITVPVSVAASFGSWNTIDSTERALMTIGPTLAVAAVETRRPNAWRVGLLAWNLVLFAIWLPWLMQQLKPDPTSPTFFPAGRRSFAASSSCLC